MITLRSVVESQLSTNPDLVFWLHEGLINISGLSRYLRPSVEKEYGQLVGLETIGMTIRRIIKYDENSLTKGIRAPKAKNIHVQLDITILSFKKGEDLDLANERGDYRFFSFAQGQGVSMLAISQENQEKFDKNAKRKQVGMAALTITLNNESSRTVGAYGYVILLLGLAGIPLAEVVTLHDDITLLISDEHVDRAFQVLRKALKNSDNIV